MAIRTHNFQTDSSKMVSAASIYFCIMSKTISKRSEIAKSVYAKAAKHHLPIGPVRFLRLHICEISRKFQL